MKEKKAETSPMKMEKIKLVGCRASGSVIKFKLSGYSFLQGCRKWNGELRSILPKEEGICKEF